MKETPTQPAARPQKLHGLSGGWIVSQKGTGLRTGHEPEGPAYFVTFWTNGAVSDEDILLWNDERFSYARESMRLGQKGAYGKMLELSKGLALRFDELVEGGLSNGEGAVISADQARLLGDAVAATEDVELFALTVYRNHVHVLFSLNGELGVDSLLERWKGAAPEVAWSADAYTQAVSPAEYAARLGWMMDELGAPEIVETAEDEAEGAEEFSHATVLLHETVDMLDPREGKLIVDATLGGGGHAELLLERGATVWGIDQDPAARRAATVRLSRFGSRFKVLSGNFRDVAGLLADQGVEKVDGLLADIGVSSHQIDTAERGFSFLKDGPLDMRMGPSVRKSAADLVNGADEKELADMIWQYGEERASRTIARAIVKARENGRIETTAQLASIIASVLPRKGKQHPGTRTFQALRIAVNDELGALDDLLASSSDILAKGGRMAVITFHSLEDRRVKQFFDMRSRPEIDRPEWPAPRPNPDYVFKLLAKKPVTAGEQELSANPRARSAKLRGVEKIK